MLPIHHRTFTYKPQPYIYLHPKYRLPLPKCPQLFLQTHLLQCLPSFPPQVYSNRLNDKYDEGVQMDPYLSLQNLHMHFLRRQFSFFTGMQPALFGIDYSLQHDAPLVQLSPQNSQFFEEVRWQFIKNYYEKCQTPNDKVCMISHQGQIYVMKRNLTPQAIQKYLIMQQIGIGVNILWHSFDEGSIVMQPGIVLNEFVRRKMNVPQLAYSLLAQTNFIQITLRRLGVAHCDIKPENMIVCNTGQGVRLLLIDMDDAVAFGQSREIGTYDRNMVAGDCHLGDRVTENTDDLGFQFVKNYICVQWDDKYPSI